MVLSEPDELLELEPPFALNEIDEELELGIKSTNNESELETENDAEPVLLLDPL